MAKTHSWGWLGGALLVALAVPSEAGAQAVSMDEPARTFLDLRSRVQPGDGVYVVDITGEGARGFIEGLSDSSLTLLVGGDRRVFVEADVETIRRANDSLRNGTVIGALVGAGSLGLLASGYGPEIAGPWALVGAGIGAGAGLVIDAALRRGPMLYRKGSGTVQLVPELSRERRALHLSFAF